MQNFIDRVLKHNEINLTVAYLRKKHKHARVPWGEELTQKKITRLSGCVRCAIITVAIIAAVVVVSIAFVVWDITKQNHNKPPQQCPVTYQDEPLKFEHCTCTEDKCVRGQYCYGLNGAKHMCHDSPGANNNQDCDV